MTLELSGSRFGRLPPTPDAGETLAPQDFLCSKKAYGHVSVVRTRLPELSMVTLLHVRPSGLFRMMPLATFEM